MDSPGFASEAQRLRERAAQPRPRVCAVVGVECFAELPLREVRSLYTEPHESEREAGRLARCRSGHGDHHADDARRYVGAVERDARRYLGSASYADALHEHVRGEPLQLDPIGHRAPQGAVASRCAAYVTGASWALGGATAMREAWRDHRPPAACGEAFSLHVRPDA